MFDTNKYRTRQETRKSNSPKGKDFVIALDAGYSSMKVFTETKHFVFPSYALKMNPDQIQVHKTSDILYRDDTSGEIYMIGREAQDMLASDNTNDTDGEMFSRKRYSNPIFIILCQTAIGFALRDKKDERKIVIQTGLPSAYVKGDTAAMKKALSKPAKFSLKIGEFEWEGFNFEINPDDIYVMPQPAGSLYSIMINNKGEFINERKRLLYDDSVLVLDVGFGTCDFYGIRNRTPVHRESIDEIGMRKVLEKTSEKILANYNEHIRVQALQRNLETGTVTCIDDENTTSSEEPIADLLEKSSDEIFKNAFDKAKAITNTFRGYNKIIVAGGTGEAWFDKIKESLSGMSSIEVIPSNINDGLPFLYSNVRGYYMFRMMQTWKNKS